jgi:hypothetical protein
MATKGMIEAVNNLLNEYIPLGDYELVMSWDLVYLRGAKYFHHRSHLSATGPDDFANNRLGMIVEALSPNPSVMKFSDIFLRSGTNQVKQGGTMIIYLEKKPRHSEEYERLCQLMRDAYFDNGHATVVIIGNRAFVDRDPTLIVATAMPEKTRLGSLHAAWVGKSGAPHVWKGINTLSAMVAASLCAPPTTGWAFSRGLSYAAIAAFGR